MDYTRAEPKFRSRLIRRWRINMVEFWHIIRNNLFHGAKDPENQRDQFAVEYGYRTLKELVELFLSEAE